MKQTILSLSLAVASTAAAQTEASSGGKCPFHKSKSTETSVEVSAPATPIAPSTRNTITGTTNRDWWPNQLNLDLLRQHSSLSDPMDASVSFP